MAVSALMHYLAKIEGCSCFLSMEISKLSSELESDESTLEGELSFLVSFLHFLLYFLTYLSFPWTVSCSSLFYFLSKSMAFSSFLHSSSF
jgi:hypothetical protein